MNFNRRPLQLPHPLLRYTQEDLRAARNTEINFNYVGTLLLGARRNLDTATLTEATPYLDFDLTDANGFEFYFRTEVNDDFVLALTFNGNTSPVYAQYLRFNNTPSGDSFGSVNTNSQALTHTFGALPRLVSMYLYYGGLGTSSPAGSGTVGYNVQPPSSGEIQQGAYGSYHFRGGPVTSARIYNSAGSPLPAGTEYSMMTY